MKSNVLLFALLVTLSNSLMAKTITVSNNTNSPGQYTDIQTAINDAGTTTGDVIIVQGSPTGYPDITVSKSIKIYGAGSLPNTPTGTRSFVNIITISANNVTISGMQSSNINIQVGVAGSRIEFNALVGPINISGSNNIIINNRIPYINIVPSASNTLILNNVLGGIIGANATYTNVVIKNNIFRRLSDGSPLNIGYDNAGSGAFGFGTVNTSLSVYDNIFYKTSLGTISNSTFSNNIFTTITTGDVSANSNTNVNNVFGMTQPNGNNFDGSQSLPANYNLGATSGATVTSSDGTQVGVNGGNVTFAMRGEAPMPYIRPVFNVSPVIITSGGTLNVTVTATNSNQ
jgi:hypothetical protein